MRYAVDAPPTPTLPIQGRDDLFPVRRIWCVGRNYAAHAREMGDTGREDPFFFAKPADALVQDGAAIPYPPRTANLHHEVELVVAIGRGGRREIAARDALGHVFGYGVGVDLTRRDLQDEAKAKRRPWEMGKGFDRSAPCSALRPAAAVTPERGAISLNVNGERRQAGDLGDMIWSVAEVIAALSGFVELAPGDLIYTGTPEGVGPLEPGDRVEGAVDGVGALAFSIT